MRENGATLVKEGPRVMAEVYVDELQSFRRLPFDLQQQLSADNRDSKVVGQQRENDEFKQFSALEQQFEELKRQFEELKRHSSEHFSKQDREIEELKRHAFKYDLSDQIELLKLDIRQRDENREWPLPLQMFPPIFPDILTT